MRLHIRQRSFQMPEPQKYIVGREAEIEILREFVQRDSGEFILNVYGPGGIGKTEVCSKITKYCQSQNWICMFIEMDAPNLTFDRVLYNLKKTLLLNKSTTGKLEKFFSEFENRFSEYLIVKEIIEREGGISALFDVLGNVIPDIFAKAIASVGKSVADETQLRFRNRYALQEYINGAEQWLTESLVDGLRQVRSNLDKPMLIVFDTYEKASHLDEWACSKLVRMLPDGIRLVISGRDRLQDMGFHWIEYAQQIESYELPELDKESVLDFYQHFGLTNPNLLEATYSFTGGYPLCMTLAVDLAHASGWNQIAGFKKQVDRYEVARHLLDRLLEQEKVAEVREFLEKGVVTLWFDVEAIAYLLQVPTEKAEDIFHRISRFSFTTKTEFGLKFHDKVRDILLERLRYMDQKLYGELLNRWREYYRIKVAEEWLEN
jgi:hypothetical protein